MKKVVNNEMIEKWRNIWNEFCLSQNSENIKNQIRIVKRELGENSIGNNIDENQIKQIECIYPSANILIMLKNGEIYLDGKLYSKNAREICVLNPYEYYIVYYPNRVETFITNGNKVSVLNLYKKVIYKQGLLATLETEGDLSIIYNFENMCDELAHLYFEDIDDIEYDEQKNDLILIKNQEKIRCSISRLMSYN